MIETLKKFLRRIPFIFNILNRMRDKYRYLRWVTRISWSRKRGSIKIVIGSSGFFNRGWIPSEKEFLNLLNPYDWKRYFNLNTIDAILAEHVWEHLTSDEGIAAARLCHGYLKKGGYLRIAVPDGLNPNPHYIENVRPGGVGPGADDHKVLYTFRSFEEVFIRAGFKCILYEYFDDEGEFHFSEWNHMDGLIHRSKRYDPRNRNSQLNYTSIILDAVK